MESYAYSLAGAMTGFIVGLSGVGGGALMTPILIWLCGVPAYTAVATDLWFAAITKMIGARMHCTTGNVDWQLAKKLWIGSLPATLLAVVWMSCCSKNKIDWLTQVIGVMVFITALGLLFAPLLTGVAKNHYVSKLEKVKKFQPVMTVLVGALMGLLVTLTSVGAGVLGSMALLFLYPLRMTPHKLVATELTHAIPIALIAGVGYLIMGMLIC